MKGTAMKYLSSWKTGLLWLIPLAALGLAAWYVVNYFCPGRDDRT
jgi:cytochrome c-type biogenesis protein CcmH/NrfF